MISRDAGRVVVVSATGVLGILLAGCMSSQRAAEIEAAAADRSPLVGRDAPLFTLPDQSGTPVRLVDYRGKWVVLYFYPRDGTPGCTCQAREFNQTHAQFQQLDAVVFGISPDTVESHRQVAREFQLKLRLLADPRLEVLDAYGAHAQTQVGGQVIRSTVLIDPAGRIVQHWPEVIPEGHAQRVRQKLAEIRAAAAHGSTETARR
jgi:peroxiredoxin Q/BCP